MPSLDNAHPSPLPNFIKVQVLNAKKYVEEGDDEEDN